MRRLTAKDVLSEDVIRVASEARPADLESQLVEAATHAVVFEEGRVLGIVPLPLAAKSHRKRRFHDLVPKHHFPKVPPSTPISDVGQLIESERVDALAVVDDTGAYLGTVSQQSLLKSLLSVVRDDREREGFDERLLIADQAIASAVTAIAISDLDFRIKYANRAFLDLFGFTDEQQVLGMSNMEFPSHPVTPAQINQAVQLEGSWTGDVTAAKTDGTRLELRLCMQVIRNASDEPLCTMATFLDLTEHNEAERQLAVSRSQVFHAGRISSLGVLATSLAHELRQPLASIINYLDACELLLGDPQTRPEQMREAIQEAKLLAVHVSQTIEQLHRFAKRQERRPSSVDVNEVICDVVHLLEPEALAKRVVVGQELADGLPLVLADSIQIQQVILNLMLNAVDATSQSPEGAREIVIQTTATRDDGTIKVSVVDTGPGFGDAQIEGLFEPFFTTKPEGLGMGLAISRSIVEAHGGKIWAENNPAGGAIFRFTLPITEGSAEA